MKFYPSPDYTAQEDINRIPTNGGTWKADKTGYVNAGISASAASNGCYIEIDGKMIMQGVFQISAIIPIAANSVIKLYLGSGTFVSAFCYFVPIKFVKIYKE
jgi:hypothetical protein